LLDVNARTAQQRRRGRLALLSAVAALLAAAVPLAGAQAPTVPDAPSGPGPAGTPVATGPYDATAGPGDPNPWVHVGGAPFQADGKAPDAKAMATSPTPFTVDFYAVK
jgi:hypothetical protein